MLLLSNLVCDLYVYLAYQVQATVISITKQMYLFV
jgi:hypothetical protein